MHFGEINFGVVVSYSQNAFYKHLFPKHDNAEMPTVNLVRDRRDRRPSDNTSVFDFYPLLRLSIGDSDDFD